MQTLNEAAEVLRLRAALKEWCDLASHLGLSTGGHRDRTHRLLAADPGPLVAAVEQMATVLGERHADTCQSLLLDCDCKLGHRRRNALAAYRAALKGEA